MSLSGWGPTALAQLEGGSVRLGVLLRIETSPVIRLWTGTVRDLAISADAVESTDGAIYQSMGLLTDVPTFNQILNGEAERVVFGLSGTAVTGEVASIASSSAADIRSVRVNLGFLVFDANWTIISPTAWPWEGVADSLSVDRTGDALNPSRTLKLSCGSLFTGRRRPDIGYWTDPDQKKRSPTDDFLDQTSRYYAGTTVVWPI